MKIEPTDQQLTIAAAAAHSAALMAYMHSLSADAGDDAAKRDQASLWFADGEVIVDRLQDEDLETLVRYCAQDRRSAETLYRKSVELGIIVGGEDGFGERGEPYQLAAALFVETVRNTVILQRAHEARHAEPPPPPASPRLSDTIFEPTEDLDAVDEARAEASGVTPPKKRSKGRTKAERLAAQAT